MSLTVFLPYQDCRALHTWTHQPSLGRGLQVSGLLQGSLRPVCLLSPASPIQEDLQRTGQSDSEEEPTYLLAPKGGKGAGRCPQTRPMRAVSVTLETGDIATQRVHLRTCPSRPNLVTATSSDGLRLLVVLVESPCLLCVLLPRHGSRPISDMLSKQWGSNLRWTVFCLKYLQVSTGSWWIHVKVVADMCREFLYL